MKIINEAGLEIIKRFEGILDGDPTTVYLDPYLCPAGVWTIGWGHAIRGKDGQLLRGAANKPVAFAKFPNGITLERAEVLLLSDAEDACEGVSSAVTTSLTDNQFSALVSFVFNLGYGNFKKSTLLTKVNARDFVGAANEFGKWTLSNGKVLKGLIARREAERALFIT